MPTVKARDTPPPKSPCRPASHTHKFGPFERLSTLQPSPLFSILVPLFLTHSSFS
ncbi:MAG: hypothetical protein ACFE92_15020 [Promethearchaeota archaeon]